MSKKDFQAAAAQQLESMRESQAVRMVQEAASTKKQKKNDSPFTIWTSAENVRRWKAYQRAKKSVHRTQADFVETALNAYMQSHPVTDEEKAELLKSLEL